MDHDFWHQRWQNNQIGFHLDRVNPWLQQFLPKLDLQRGQQIFLPLCGKSKDILWLHEQSYRVLGIDISPIAIQSFFSENRLIPETTARGHFTVWCSGNIELLCGDFFSLTSADLADVAGVYDRAASIAFPPDLRKRYAERLAQRLPDGARTLLITLEYFQDQMQGPPFSVEESEVHALYGPANIVRLLYGHDVLAANPHFRERGLTRLDEKAYLLTHR